MILVTGGAGFIGSNFILDWLAPSGPAPDAESALPEAIINVDLLTYAGNMNNLASLPHHARHLFVHADIGDTARIAALLAEHRPRAILHFAAESHVDRSILGPAAFVATNIAGTFSLLEAARGYWSTLDPAGRAAFRFLQVSTDEVFGSLGADDAPFSESTAYAPNSPYSASKAAADHLVRAYHHTYGLPTLTTHCSNNYGPYHFPEKLIPLMIANALAGKPLPIYGDGQNVRDWLYVSDHCAALRRVLADGRPGDTYNIGGCNEMTNLDVVHTLCDILDSLVPKPDAASYRTQIAYVADRPGHDRRYAIDAAKIARELGWRPAETFETGIRKTVQWYLDNPGWVSDVQSGAYRSWVERNYSQRASAAECA